MERTVYTPWWYWWMGMLVCCILVQKSSAQNYQSAYTIQEELPSGSFVGNLSKNFQFVSEIPREDVGSIHFSFLQQNHVKSLLNVSESLGIIMTAVVLDRESDHLCESYNPCILTFDIAVRSTRPQSSFFAIITVTLTVNDINDNSPVFPNDQIYLDISESTVIGTAFHIDSASDLDAGDFSIENYEIGKQDGNFGLNVIRKLDGSFTVKLIVNAELNREVKDQYSIIIIAMDGGSPQNFGTVAVNITVTDINDNAPVFSQPFYNITIHENVTIGTTILHLTATDSDINENGRVIYRFSPHQLDARVSNLFSVSMDTGDVMVKNKIVYESGSPYKIIVEASDLGNQPQVAQVRITVYVIDVGNNPPSVIINLLSSGNSKIKNISEASTKGTFVAHINVEDTDTGNNGRVYCDINNEHFRLQSLTGKGYKITVEKPLDRETKDLHSIVVSCHDYGSPSLTTSSEFMVSVLDENDNAPIFTQATYTGTWSENRDDFSPFVTVKALDKDFRKNADIKYFLDRSSKYRFWIDQDSGDIRANQVFDRESTPEISFTVTAVDEGSPALTGKATVMVIISDRNDNVPHILEPREFHVMENLNSDTLVGRLRATDFDEGINAKVMFKSKDENTVPFVVFPDGSIKTNQQLDREVVDHYTFSVVVFDQGTPRLSSIAEITVFVDDENDHSPVINHPSPENSTFIVYDNVKPGTKIVQIEASDEDEGPIASYTISSGNEDNLFIADSSRGGIYLTKAVSVKDNRSFHLVVTVSDEGDNSVTAELTIVVRASNESALANPGEEDGNNNVIIVIVVVVVTLVLSLIMILTICFLRRFDSQHRIKDKNGQVIMTSDDKLPSCYLDTANGGPTLNYDPISMVTKKKEVSFDIEEPILAVNSKDCSILNASISAASEPEHEQTSPVEETDLISKGRQLNKIQLLQYHQAVLESQTRAWLQSQDLGQEHDSFEVTLPDDKYSDTSGEVTASDSGKGGSEDDLPNNQVRGIDKKCKTLAVPLQKVKTHYVAPEFRQQEGLQHQARGLSMEDTKFRTVSPEGSAENLQYRPSSSLSHSTPRPNSRAAVHFPQTYVTHMPLDVTVENPDWDAASYV